jgi:hypothetical protein
VAGTLRKFDDSLVGIRRIFAATSAAECSASDDLNDGGCTALTAPFRRNFLTHGHGSRFPASSDFAVQRPTQVALTFDHTSSHPVVNGTQ